MSISAKVLADSIAPCGQRLTTLLCRYPRPIHSEIMTHRETSKCSASSRAIPTATLIDRIEADPWIPDHIGANQRGMQAEEMLSPDKRELALGLWRGAISNAINSARAMMELGVHKQVVNRLIEPGMHIEIILSSTSWTNWDGLRAHPAAEPHFNDLARAIIAAREGSTPRQLRAGDWHTPLFGPENGGHENDWSDLDEWIAATHAPGTSYNRKSLAAKVSVGRCARVSYLTHEGKRDIAKDMELHDRLIVQVPLHATPAEHAARAMDWPEWFTDGYPWLKMPIQEMQDRVLTWRREKRPGMSVDIMAQETVLAHLRSGNFMGFEQYRKMLPNEYIGGLRP